MKRFFAKTLTASSVIAVIVNQDIIAMDNGEALEVGKQTGEEVNQQSNAETLNPEIIVPGYQSDQSIETDYYRNPNEMENAADEAISQSDAAQTVVQGQLHRPAVSLDAESDPLIQNNQAIADNPDAIIGTVTGEYSDCQRKVTTQAGSPATDVCQVYQVRETRTCERTLSFTCELQEEKREVTYPASYQLVAGEGEGCSIDFTEEKQGTQRVNVQFDQECPTCNPSTNPLYYEEYSYEACTKTWEYQLRLRLLGAYDGIITAITFGPDLKGGTATINVTETHVYCDWREDWDDSDCQPMETAL